MQHILKRKYWTMFVAAGAAISCGVAAAYAAGFTLPAPAKIAFLYLIRRTTAAGPRLLTRRVRKSRPLSA